MDPASIVEDSEWTQSYPQTDKQTDRRTDRRMDGLFETSIPPFNVVEVKGITTSYYNAI